MNAICASKQDVPAGLRRDFFASLTADIPKPFLKTRPAAQVGRRSATAFAELGCVAHRPRRWRAGRQKRRRLTDWPSTMSRAIHAAIYQASRQCARSVHPW